MTVDVRPIAQPDSSLVDALSPSRNFGSRKDNKKPSILLLHYTGVATAEAAITWLADPRSEVSCHYVVDERGRITQMVAEAERAWHAGAGFWAGDTDINSSSIGIEIHNVGHAEGYPDFPDAQINAVTALGLDIVTRYAMRPERVLAHSDIAPQRKIDPGEKFPWGRLAAGGVGHWTVPAPLSEDVGHDLGSSHPDVARVQALLKDYGYGLEVSGSLDSETQFVLQAFQRHFRPARVDGRLDRSTFATLDALMTALETPARTS